ncbi:MAG: MMPL family transporter [Myxococcota bacterium]|nr:MMPL family transporter [Myxococcota bacterium]
MKHSRSSPLSNFTLRLNQGFASLAGWSFDHRVWVSLFAVALLGISLTLASRAQVDSSYEAYFDPADPIFETYEKFQSDFGSDEIAYILYSAPGSEFGPWNLEIMRKVASLTTALEEEVPFIYEVRSLTNAELMLGEESEIRIHKIGDDFPENQEELLELREAYLAKPIMVNGILSADAQHAAIIIEMDRTSTDPLEDIRLDPAGGDNLDNLYPQVTDSAIREILDRPEFSNFVFDYSGDVPFNAAYNVIIEDESTFLGMVTALVIALILFAAFRSFLGVFAPLFVVQMSVAATIAFIVLLGWKLDLSFGSIPTLLTAIGVAHSVHILSAFRQHFPELGDRREALVKTLYLVGTPCLLTSVTTAIGFAAMSFVPIKSIAHMGVYSSAGALLAFVLSVTVLLALLSFGSATPKKSSRSRVGHLTDATMDRFLGAIRNFVIRWRIGILIFSALILALSAMGIAKMQVDSNMLDDLSDSVPLKASTLRIDEIMGGVTNLVLLFDGGESDSIKDPLVMQEIDRIQEWANRQEIVKKSYSITDIVKDLNQTFHAGDPDFYRIPDDRNLIAQYLILYESAGGADASKYVSSDYQHAHLELRLRLGHTSKLLALKDGLLEELSKRPLSASKMEITGIGALWIKLVEYIVSSQIQGFLIAFSAIALMMCLLLGSARTGFLAMVPNLVPILLTLGAMGWLDIPLDYAKAGIAAVAMGIAVDDTIHLVLRFRHEFLACGSYSEALNRSLQEVGRALVITSIALTAGFLVLLLSVLDSQAIQGLLLSVTIVTALVADFLLMPALILTFKPFGPEKADPENTSQA